MEVMRFKENISAWIDNDIAFLKKELQKLENCLNQLNIEKSELEKLLSNFHHQHTIELGDIILEILKLRKEKFKDDEQKFEEAKRDYESYNQQAVIEKEKKVYDLSDEQKQELKKRFRNATKLCHPDKVSEEFKADAEKKFVDLKNAYEANDLDRVIEILNNLEKGNFFTSASETISEKEKLIAQIEKMKIQIQSLERDIESIKTSDTYKTVSSIEDWDDFFSKLKVKLSMELESLRSKVKS
jgi:hypothetical protein